MVSLLRFFQLQSAFLAKANNLILTEMTHRSHTYHSRRISDSKCKTKDLIPQKQRCLCYTKQQQLLMFTWVQQATKGITILLPAPLLSPLGPVFQLGVWPWFRSHLISANFADFHKQKSVSKLQSAGWDDPAGGVGCGEGGGHFCSSSPSVQSCSPSHFQWMLMHRSSVLQ